MWCSWRLPCRKAQGPGGQVRAGGASSHQATSTGGCNESSPSTIWAWRWGLAEGAGKILVGFVPKHFSSFIL